MGNPTPKQPIVLNADGSVSVLVYANRTFRLQATHAGLTSSVGYKARFGMTDKYGNALLASADSEDGTITFAPAVAPKTGTVISVTIPDEEMAITAKAGKLDMVLEEPGGAEIPIMVGDWTLYRDVTP